MGGLTPMKSVSQVGHSNIFGVKDRRVQNFDIDGIIKNPNTNIKKYALGNQLNFKKLNQPESTKYSKAPMITNSLSNISPAMMRGKRSGAGANLSMSIDVDSLGGLIDGSLQNTPPRKQKLNLKMNPNLHTVDSA
jgi:hypothetical protein